MYLHITKTAAYFRFVRSLSPPTSQPEVSQQHVVVGIQKNIFWLQVPVGNVSVMQVGNRVHQLPEDSPSFLRWQSAPSGDVVGQIASSCILENEVDRLFGDNHLVELQHVWMVQLAHDLVFLSLVLPARRLSEQGRRKEEQLPTAEVLRHF